MSKCKECGGSGNEYKAFRKDGSIGAFRCSACQGSGIEKSCEECSHDVIHNTWHEWTSEGHDDKCLECHDFSNFTQKEG